MHESTKVTPYELVFGRKANHFEDWTCKPTNDENNEMLGRTLEIKKLFEETIPKARENLAKSAEVQKNNQNKRDTISNEKIRPGTQVFIKAEGLLTKMANRYYGPYTVVREADGGNYVLKNALDEEMKLSFPRQKLKIVEKIDEDNETNLEIDSVIDSKIENNEQYFLVKWKNSDEVDWLPLSSFNSTDCISEYNRRKSQESEDLTRKTRR